MLDGLQKISNSAKIYVDKLVSEEITKTVLLFPFLSSLGYDVSNPLEIIPEYHADFSDVKADKADLCIIIDNQPSIIIELKKLGTKFDTKHRRQLAQYFHWVQSINLAILTDGILYEFYSDLNNHNQMDEKPFFTINLHDLNDDDIQFLEMITKQSFNINNITEFANKMNITKILFNQINENFNTPDEDYIKFILTQILEKLPNKVINSKTKSQYLPNILQAHKNLIDEEIRKRLGVNIEEQVKVPIEKRIENHEETKEIKDEYIYGFNIFKAIICEYLDIKRLYLRETQSYCNVLIDDNKNKTIARMMFNNPKKLKINIFDDKEEILDLEEISDIYKYSQKIKFRVEQIINNYQLLENTTTN